MMYILGGKLGQNNRMYINRKKNMLLTMIMVFINGLKEQQGVKLLI